MHTLKVSTVLFLLFVRLLNRLDDIVGHFLHIQGFERRKGPLHGEQLDNGLPLDAHDKIALAGFFAIHHHVRPAADGLNSLHNLVGPRLEGASLLAGLNRDDHIVARGFAATGRQGSHLCRHLFLGDDGFLLGSDDGLLLFCGGGRGRTCHRHSRGHSFLAGRSRGASHDELGVSSAVQTTSAYGWQLTLLLARERGRGCVNSSYNRRFLQTTDEPTRLCNLGVSLVGLNAFVLARWRFTRISGPFSLFVRSHYFFFLFSLPAFVVTALLHYAPHALALLKVRPRISRPTAFAAIAPSFGGDPAELDPKSRHWSLCAGTHWTRRGTSRRRVLLDSTS